MSIFRDASDYRTRLRSGCSCGAHESQAAHDSAPDSAVNGGDKLCQMAA